MRTALLALIVILAAGCPKPRTSAATQPTPAAFDPTKSDPKAVELADAGLAAVGGHDKWEAVKELVFGITVLVDNVPKIKDEHHWDRWNGRHYYVNIDMSTMTGKPDDIKALEVRYDLFDSGKKPWATYDGKEMMRAEADKAAANAKVKLIEHGYLFTVIHRLRDPGVHLAIAAEGEMPSQCDPGCTSVKVTFDPTVGKDTWYVAFNNASHLPELIAQEKGKGHILGYKIDGWLEAGGLKFPKKLQNIALPSEVIEFDDAQVGEPEDNTYMRQVTEG